MNTKKFRNQLQKYSNADITWKQIEQLNGESLFEPLNDDMRNNLIKYIVYEPDFRQLLRYYARYENFKEEFSLERFINTKGKLVSQNSLESQIERFGVKLGTEYYNIAMEKVRNRNVYDINYHINRGKTLDEAVETIKNIKNRTSGSRQNYIRKYGKIEGKKRYKQFCVKSSNSLEKFILKYGDEIGKIKWSEYKKKKDSMSISYFKQKFGDKWEEKRNERIKSTTITRDLYIKKYGEVLGLKKWLGLCRRRRKKIIGASKQSLACFEPILEFLDENNIEYIIGKDRREFGFYDVNIEKTLYYDFVIPSLNLCIEYHGTQCHPNVKNMSAEDKVNWKCVYSGRTCDEAWEWDQYKKHILKESHNIDMIEIYSDEYRDLKKRDKLYQEIFNTIKDRINENQENN